MLVLNGGEACDQNISNCIVGMCFVPGAVGGVPVKRQTKGLLEPDGFNKMLFETTS